MDKKTYQMSRWHLLWYVPLGSGILIFGWLNPDFGSATSMACVVLTMVIVSYVMALSLKGKTASRSNVAPPNGRAVEKHIFWFLPLAVAVLVFGVVKPEYLRPASDALLLMALVTLLVAGFLLWKNAVTPKSAAKASGGEAVDG